MSKYLSRVNAQLTLERALRRIDLTPDSFEPQHLENVVPHLERSLNLFVERARLPHLLAELGQQQAPANLTDRIVEISKEADLSEARVQARQLCRDLGVSTLTTQKIATLVSELARNIVLYAQSGRIELSPQLEPRKSIIVRACDQGPGIRELDRIMAGDYRSTTGLGMGLRGCKRLSDRFNVDTGEKGTRIEAEIHI